MQQKELTRRDALRVLTGAPIALSDLLKTPEQQRPVVAEVSYYHEVNENRFYNDIDSKLQRGLHPISLKEFYLALSGEITVPFNSFVTTWDDGLQSQHTQGLPALARIQEDYGVFIPVTLFAMTRFEGLPFSIADIPDDTPSHNDRVHRYLTKAQILEFLAKGHNIQNITVDHVNILGISGSYLEQEVGNAERSINELYELAGKEREVKAFAYPYGAVNQLRARFIEEQGFDMAFSTQRTTTHNWQNRFTLGRIAR